MAYGTVKLYQFPPAWELPTLCPFCLKVETFLRMTGIPYHVAYIDVHKETFEGRFPYTDFKGIRTIGSTKIIAFLKDFWGDSLDGTLDSVKKSTGYALCRMVEDHLYWCMLYYRWVDEEYWDIFKDEYFKDINSLFRKRTAKKINKEMVKRIYMQGIGRFSPEEVSETGRQALWNLSKFLGNKKYFFGPKPTSIDAVIYGFLANIIFVPIPSPLKIFLQSLPNLQDYCELIKDKYYNLQES